VKSISGRHAFAEAGKHVENVTQMLTRLRRESMPPNNHLALIIPANGINSADDLHAVDLLLGGVELADYVANLRLDFAGRADDEHM
jgi:hypothetical protein